SPKETAMQRMSFNCWPGLPAVLACVLPGLARAAEEPKPAFNTIALTSSGGFTGRGSGKALTVDAEGEFVARTRDKRREGPLKPEGRKQRRDGVGAVDWKEVKPSYRGRGADFFQDDLVVQIAGKKQETHVSEQVERKDLPRALGGLLTYLDGLHARYKP